MPNNKKEKGLFEKSKEELIDGYTKIIKSLNDGISQFYNNTYLLLKYTLLTIVLSILYIFVQNIPYIAYIYFVPITFIILYFYHDYLKIKVNDIGRFTVNLFSLVLLLLISYTTITFNPQSQSQQQFPLVHLISTFISLFAFALFLFQPIYMVKAGATPLKALSNAFKFISNNALKTMVYIMLLFFMLASLSSILSLIPYLSLISLVVFIYLSYAVFMFIYSFWEVCRQN